MEISAGDRRPRPLFLGYPVNFSQVFPSATATATIPIILGDLALAAMFGDRQQEGIAFSNTAVVGGESTFERNQIAIRGTERFDIVTHDVGTSSVVGPVVALKTGS
jgi:HK97 family phage major capsid protein